MLTLKQLKNDMQFNQELSGLIDILKAVASSQFRHLQARREIFMRFNKCLDGFFTMVNFLKSTHLFLKEDLSLPQGILIITSDEGFLGGLNNQIANAGLDLLKSGDEIIVLGEKGARFFEEAKVPFLYFSAITEDIEYARAEDIKDYLINAFLKKRFGKIMVVYPKFVSFSVQEVKIEQLLPYPIQTHEGKKVDTRPKEEIIVEPSEERIIDYLIRVWLLDKIYNIFWESKLSEWAARVMHLEGSSQELNRIAKKLNFSYFRSLHEISDKNIREIFASRLIR
jgi:F-type H+-transporting ATPase subunit gamma